LKRFPSYVDAIPRGNEISRPRDVTDSVSGEKDNLLVKCGNLAYRVVWRGTVPHRNATISRYDDFVLTKVEYPDGAVLDLGKCSRTNNQGNYEHTKSFHVILQSESVAITYGDETGETILENFIIFISWNNKHWYQLMCMDKSSNHTTLYLTQWLRQV
jgi:hypothetical protein